MTTITAKAPGGMVLMRRKLKCTKKHQGFFLLSDIHIGDIQVDHELLDYQLLEASKRGDRILINGDVFDAILTKDEKRYDPNRVHKRLRGCNDIVNKSVDFAEEILAPYAHLIDVIGSGNHECHDDQTEVLCSRGWVLFQDLNEEDQLGTFNKHSGKIEYQKPQSIHSYDYNGPMYMVGGRSNNWCVTPNHRMIYRSIGNPFWNINEMQDLADFAMLQIPCSGKSLNPEYPVSDSQLGILAWLLTDGNVSRDKGVITFYQRESKVHLILKLLDQLNAPYKVKVRHRNITQVCGRTLVKQCEPSCEVRLYTGELKEWLREHVTYEKRLPPWLSQLSDRQFTVFLSSVVDGDGSRHKTAPDTSWMVYGLKPFLDDLQILCVTHGYRTSLSTYRTKDYRLNITPHTTKWISRFAANVSEVAYTGKVWCATVWNDSLVTRRKGCILISGNSTIEHYHSTDMIDLLVRRLEHHTDHTIYHGSYTGFAQYTFNQPSQKLTIFYWHGAGGGSGVGGSANEFVQKGFVTGADVMWFAHRHQRLVTQLDSLSCPDRFQHPKQQSIWCIRTGSYLDPYAGQTQAQIRKHGRQANYAVDRLMRPQARGGVRLVCDLSQTPIKTSVELT